MNNVNPHPIPVDYTARPLALIREALALLDQSGRMAAADLLQYAIDIIEEENWASVGIQIPHRIIQ